MYSVPELAKSDLHKLARLSQTEKNVSVTKRTICTYINFAKEESGINFSCEFKK
jgi:hypothetical protein